MSSQPARQEPALSDATRARFDREVAKYPADQRQSAVMGCLRIMQEERGWISPQTEEQVAQYLGMPPSRACRAARRGSIPLRSRCR